MRKARKTSQAVPDSLASAGMSSAFPRRVLLCVTGLSPQVLTETLYALAVQGTGAARFVPTEIHVVSTTAGLGRVHETLLEPRSGAFHAMVRDYKLSGVRFDETTLHVIVGEDGTPLDDIRAPEDNERVGDAIIALVRSFTDDPDCSVHVSLAGGRKTMGFYAGYAISLLGRAQDRLSHVLINEPFDAVPDFFYPRPRAQVLRDRQGNPVDTSMARVTLAMIPFVRMRQGLPPRLMEGVASFSETVAAMGRALRPPSLSLSIPGRLVDCGGTPIRLQDQLFAFYLWFARRRADGVDGDGCVIPGKRGVPSGDFLSCYRSVVGAGSGDLEIARQRLRAGLDAEFIREKRARINAALLRELGPGAAPYLIVSTGPRGATRYGLGLDREAICIAAG